MKIHYLPLFFIVALSACGEKTIDANSEETMKASVEEMKANMPKGDQEHFDKALQAVIFAGAGNLLEVAKDPEAFKASIKTKLDGKTAAEILTQGNALLAERETKRRTQAFSEIAEIEADIAELVAEKREAMNAKDKLKKFEVIRSRFYFRESDYSSEAIIELTVKNNTDKAISRAYFDGVLISKGRSVPWVEETFNYPIPGGLEPGEEVTWKLSPNLFGEWGNAPKDRDDMVFTATVTRINGVDEKAIYDTSFTDYKEEQLSTLASRLTSLKESLL